MRDNLNDLATILNATSGQYHNSKVLVLTGKKIMAPASNEDKNRRDSDVVFVPATQARRVNHRTKLPPLKGTLPTLNEATCFHCDADSVGQITENLSIASEDCSVQSKSLLDGYDVNRMKQHAAHQASKGEEDAALMILDKLLELSNNGIDRIKRRLGADGESLSPSKVALLRNDWIQISMTIAEVQTIMAVLHERKGEFDMASICCEKVQEIYERIANGNLVDGWDTQDMRAPLGKITRMFHCVQRAIGTIKKREMLLQNATLVLDSIKTKCTDNDANSETEKLYEYVFKSLGDLLTTEVEIFGSNHPRICKTLCTSARAYLQKNDLRKAIQMQRKSVDIAVHSLGHSHPTTGEQYFELALVFLRLAQDSKNDADSKESNDYFEKTVDILRDISSSEPRKEMIFMSLWHIGLHHIRSKQYGTAAEKLQDARDLIQTRVLSDEQKSVQCILTLKKLAICYRYQKQWVLALETLSEVFTTQRQFRRNRWPKKNSFDWDMKNVYGDASYCNTLLQLGKAHTSLGQHQEAFQLLEEALSICRRTFRAVSNSGSDSSCCQVQDGMASVLYCLAEVCDAMGNADKAVSCFDKSLEFRLVSDSQRPENRTNLVHCSMCLSGIGAINMRKKVFAEARTAYRDALKFCEAGGLAKRHPIRSMIVNQLKETELKIRTKTSDLEPSLGTDGMATKRKLAWFRRPGVVEKYTKLPSERRFSPRRRRLSI